MKKILLVEDEGLTAMALKSSLVDLGFEVPEIVTNGKDSIRAAAEIRPDLVLMDITLDGPMSGIEAADEIRKVCAIPIVFLTAHSDAGTIEKARLTEPFGFIPKPCKIDTLMSTIEVALYKGEADARRRMAEDAVKVQQKIFEAIFEQSLAGYWDWRIRDGTLFMSPTLKKMFGYEDHELPNTIEALFSLMLPEDVPDSNESVRRHFESRGNVPFNRESRYRHKNGLTVWVICTGKVIEWDEKGQPVRMVGCHVDITDHKRAEENLRFSEEKFRALAEQSITGVCMIQDGRFIYVNPRMEEIFGFGHEEMTGLQVLDLVAEADRDMVRENMRRRLSGEVPYMHYSFRALKKDSSEIIMDVHGSTMIYNERPAIIGTLLDITAPRQAMDALKEGEERYRNVYETAPLAIVLWDRETRITDWNDQAEKIFGWKREEVIGQNFFDYIIPESARVQVQEVVQLLLEGRLPSHSINDNITKEGRIIVCEWNNAIMRDTMGNIAGVTSLGLDITERRRAEEKLQDSEAKLSKAQEIAHLGNWEWDLRTNKITWSDELYRIYDLEDKKNRLTYYMIMERVHPDDRAYHDKLTRDWLKNCGGAPFEYRIVRSDGSMRYIYGPGEVECDNTGKPVRMFGIAQDVTERVIAEEELKRSEETLRLAHEVAHVGSWVWDISTGLLTWSKEVYELFGIDDKKKPSYQEFLATLHAEDSTSVINAINAAVSRREDFNIEYRIIKTDKTIRHVHAKGKAFYDSTGKPVRMLGLISDITDRKKNEELLQLSEERYRRITESITDYIYTVRLEAGRPVETIHGDTCIGVTGYSSQDFAADPYLWIRMVVAEDHDIVRKQIDQLLSGNQPEPIEHRIVRKDGCLRWVESSLIPSRDRQGNPISYYGIIRDITEHKTLERELIEIEDRERRRIGHDLHDGLGQLLTGLAFKIRSLGRKLEEGHFEGADEAAELSVLIDQAKEQVSFLSRGLSPLVIEKEGLTVTLNALCYYTNKMFGTHCYFKCKEPVLVHNETALTQLYRITQEAVTNAAKHAKPTRIDIDLTKDRDKITITVKDNGIGIPEDIDNSRGMGLKIMKYRAGIINASLDIKQDIGGGTIVTCTYSDAKESISN